MRSICCAVGGEQEPPGGGAALHCQEDRLPRAHPAQRRSQRSLCQYIQRRALPPQQDGRQKCWGRRCLFIIRRMRLLNSLIWHGEGAAGLSCTELSFWEFPFLRGGGRGCWQGGNSIWYCVNGMPQKETLDKAAYTWLLVSYRRLSPEFQFSLSAVTL